MKFTSILAGAVVALGLTGAAFAQDVVMLRNARWKRTGRGGIELNTTMDQSCEIKHSDPTEAEAWGRTIEALCVQTSAGGGGYSGDAMTMFGAFQSGAD